MAAKMVQAHTQASAALRLLELVWKNCASAIPHSWRLVNRSMQQALYLAIEAGLSFGLDDFQEMSKRFRIGYWFGETYGESFYARAVAVGNLAAAQSFEAWKSRRPLIADKVSHGRSSRQRDRVALGSTFQYRSQQVTVTSFVDGGVIACTYKSKPKGYARAKIARRLRVTAEDIQADRIEEKRRKHIWDALLKSELTPTQRRQFQDITGIKTEKDFRRCPLNQLEKAFAEVIPAKES